MTAVGERREYAFQAEIKQLLNLLAHSLYQSRDVAIRELVSNASDALDKMRFLALSNDAYRDSGELEMTIEPRADAMELVVRDNGIGMTRDELVSHLGTIAKSGSLEFLRTLGEDSKKDVSLIGQFGVGFYAAFMIADRVRVRSKSYKDDQANEWESDGTGVFQVVPIETPFDRGTEIILHLKDDAKEFIEEWKIREAIRSYSSFISYPIRIGGAIVNDQKPIWVEPKNQVTSDQHEKFYQYLTHHTDEKPLWHIHLAVDSPIQFRAVIYCPPTNVEKFGMGRSEHGISLCAKRILVDRECRDLLPEYFRFLRGLVDSEDLPLNVSRETLQNDTLIRKIRDSIVKAIFDRLDRTAADQPDDYKAFYDEFGTFLKEGAIVDFLKRDRIAPLLRFPSTHSDQLTSLGDYVSRCEEGRKQIYYACGVNRASIVKSPALEIFLRRGIEVLLLDAPVDEVVMVELRRFGDKDLKSIDAADVELPPQSSDESEPEPTKEPGGFGRLLELFRSALGDQVRDVRASKRLIESACRLVDAEGAMSSRLERMLRATNQQMTISTQIFEINPSAQLIERLASLSANPDHDEFIKRCGLQLFTDALALEGVVHDPHEAAERSRFFMEEAAAKRSPLVL